MFKWIFLLVIGLFLFVIIYIDFFAKVKPDEWGLVRSILALGISIIVLIFILNRKRHSKS
jgi:hypothetical protein